MIVALFEVVEEGISAGDIPVTDMAVAQPLSEDFERLRAEFDFSGDDSAVAKCFALWARLVGAISFEGSGQYGADTLTDPGAVFDIQVLLLTDMLTA